MSLHPNFQLWKDRPCWHWSVGCAPSVVEPWNCCLGCRVLGPIWSATHESWWWPLSHENSKQQTYFEHEFLIVFFGNFKVLAWTWPFLNRLLMWSSDLCHPRILVTRSEAESEKNHRWWTGVSTLQVWMKMNEKVWTRLEEHEKR